MSWWVSLEDKDGKPDCSYGDPGEDACPTPCYRPVEVDRFQDGGTQPVGGTTEATLNITYNYSPFYYEFLDKDSGLSWLDGKTGVEALARLINAVDQLGTERDANYWAATQGNAGAALARLAAWAKQQPKATFRVN